MNNKINLHLGCGDKRLENFINIDCRNSFAVDEIDDIKKLKNYKKNSVDLIYCCHVLEHFGRNEYIEVLKRWHEILKPNGILRLAVPNFEKICEHYQQHKNLPLLMGLLYGRQNYKENYHYTTFDHNCLEKDLIEVGFCQVRTWDWRETNHSHIDDYSQSYLPHMDKKNGVLMSLNIEAEKGK